MIMLLNIFAWYLAIALVGWIAFPLAYRILVFLPDRGLALARPLGLLLWGYLYWLLVSLHLLQNDIGGVFFALLLVTALSVWALRGGEYRGLFGWLRGNTRLIITTELLFLLGFAVMAVVRAAIPDASGTEKPMELAFINAILRSPDFPPSDPWLSGYAISYYYFGYVMVGMLARFTSTTGAVAFNLALASWYALTALAAYGLLYNLLAKHAQAASTRLWALLAPLFLLLVSNMQGFLEMLHARGLFWQRSSTGGWESSFWRWLDIQEVTQPPGEPFSWMPHRGGGIWWWRASRVLQDYGVDGNSREIIDEFPAFSYLLGDLHPHVLAMPFALLATCLALNVYYKLRAGDSAGQSFGKQLLSVEFWLSALVLGSLSFLNTWDFPIYLGLYAAAITMAHYQRDGWRWDLLYRFLGILLLFGLAGGVLYLPFYLGFSSQAGGLLPSLVFFTRGAHLWVMFAPLLLPLLGWLIFLWRRNSSRSVLWQSVLLSAALITGLWLLSILFGLALLQGNPGLASIWGATDGPAMILSSIMDRLAAPGGWLTLLALLILVLGSLLMGRQAEVDEQISQTELPVTAEPNVSIPSPTADGLTAGRLPQPFVLLLILVGLGLVLFPEFFYLRDQFGWRMNTIFKFYFQAWILWAVAAAYASIVLLRDVRGVFGRVVAVGWVIMLLVSLPYPVFGVLSRTNNFQPTEWTLNGAAYLDRYSPKEMEAIRWLQTAPYGVVAEAIGGSYSGYARVSTHSGLPTVLGWPGHESQWRGGFEEVGSRQPDIEKLFRARQWSEARSVLEQYNIRYVFLGPLESGEYRSNRSLFDENLVPVFDNGEVIIYEVPRLTIQQGQVMQP